MFCPKCGTQNQEESVFCMKCGYRLPILDDLNVSSKHVNDIIHTKESETSLNMKDVPEKVSEDAQVEYKVSYKKGYNPTEGDQYDWKVSYKKDFDPASVKKQQKISTAPLSDAARVAQERESRRDSSTQHQYTQYLLNKTADHPIHHEQQPHYQNAYFSQTSQNQQYQQNIVPVPVVISPPIQKPVSPTRIVFGILIILAGLFLLFAVSFVGTFFRYFENADEIIGVMSWPAWFTLATGIVLVATCKTFSGGYISGIMLFFLAYEFHASNIIMDILIIMGGITLIVTIVAEYQYNAAIKARNNYIQSVQQGKMPNNLS